MNESIIKQRTLFGEEIEDWEFSKANTTYLTHGIHQYPARMIPQIANRLIHRYTKQDCVIVDPFSGSGSVNLEAMLNKRNSYGFDINPLGHLIQKVKSTPIENENLDEIREYFKEKLRTNEKNPKKTEELVEFPNINLWFKDYVINKLLFIKSLFTPFKDYKIKNLLNLIFSRTVFDVANIDKEDNPYFIRSLKGNKLKLFKPIVTNTFLENLHIITKNIGEFSREVSKEDLLKYQPTFYLKDSRQWNFEDGDVNAIITSPPYGEEKNTMSYMRFAKLSLYWQGWTPQQLKELEKNSLGWSNNGNRIVNPPPSETLNELVANLDARSQENRAKEVIFFFQDYYELMKKAYSWLDETGHFCIVIGNRTAKGIPVLNDRISVELGRNIGFSHLKTYYRKIPYKVLPKHDDKTELINAESIVILKK